MQSGLIQTESQNLVLCRTRCSYYFCSFICRSKLWEQSSYQHILVFEHQNSVHLCLALVLNALWKGTVSGTKCCCWRAVEVVQELSRVECFLWLCARQAKESLIPYRPKNLYSCPGLDNFCSIDVHCRTRYGAGPP